MYTPTQTQVRRVAQALEQHIRMFEQHPHLQAQTLALRQDLDTLQCMCAGCISYQSLPYSVRERFITITE